MSSTHSTATAVDVMKTEAPPQGVGIGASLLSERVERVAKIASMNADDVDRNAIYPTAAMAAARLEGLLGVLIPTELGGEGASIHDVMEMCYSLGKACSATAMIVAMHHVKVACIVRHGRGNPWMENLMRRIAREQLLMGSSTTEGTNGGNIRASAAPAEVADGRFSLDRDATVISYGLECDGIVTTARRSAQSSASDQVLVVVMKEDYSLEPTQGWDVLGMRGTCSIGFRLKASGTTDQILEPYDRIHTQSMVPFAHLTWGSAWTGVAAGAVERAQMFLRHVARNSGGQMPPGARHFGLAKASLGHARALLTTTAHQFERLSGDTQALGDLSFQSAIAGLKVEISNLAVETVMSALRATGLSGYRNDGQFSVSRHLRDVLSAPIMIHNDRILANTANANLLGAVAPTLRA